MESQIVVLKQAMRGWPLMEGGHFPVQMYPLPKQNLNFVFFLIIFLRNEGRKKTKNSRGHSLRETEREKTYRVQKYSFNVDIHFIVIRLLECLLYAEYYAKSFINMPSL